MTVMWWWAQEDVFCPWTPNSPRYAKQ